MQWLLLASWSPNGEVNRGLCSRGTEEATQRRHSEPRWQGKEEGEAASQPAKGRAQLSEELHEGGRNLPTAGLLLVLVPLSFHAQRGPGTGIGSSEAPGRQADRNLPLTDHRLVTTPGGSHLSRPLTKPSPCSMPARQLIYTVARTGTAFHLPPCRRQIPPITGRRVSRCGVVICTHANRPARVHPARPSALH